MKLNKIITIVIILGFLTSLISLFIASDCEEKNIEDCLIKKEYLMPDFYWHTNTIKYIANYGLLPEKVLSRMDGGEDGSSLNGETKNIIHSPLYYYLGAGVFLISKNIGINPVFVLHLFSIILMLITNIIFFLLVKSLFKNLIHKKQLIIIATTLFVFFPINLYVSLAIHNHALFYLFMILSFYIYNKFLEDKSIKNSIFLGLSLGFTLLSSLTGLPLIVSLLIITLYDYINKKKEEGNLLLISLIIGSILGSFTLIRNYLLFADPIWGGITDPMQSRSFLIIFNLMKSFFGGIYGGYDRIYYIILISSIFILITLFYGILNLKVLKRKIYFILLMAILTLLLSFHTFCNIFYIFNGVCFGDIIHGRYFLGIVPALSILSSLGFVKILKDKKILIYFLLIIIVLVYSFDFIYAFISQ